MTQEINCLDHREMSLYVSAEHYKHKEKLTELFNAYYMHLYIDKQKNDAYLAWQDMPYATSEEKAKKQEAYKKYEQLLSESRDCRLTMEDAEFALKL